MYQFKKLGDHKREEDLKAFIDSSGWLFISTGKPHKPALILRPNGEGHFSAYPFIKKYHSSNVVQSFYEGDTISISFF